MKKTKLRINKLKIIYVPVIISIISFFVIAVFAYNISANYMENQMIKSNIELTELLSRKIEGELENNEAYCNQITDTLLNAGRYALKNNEKISNAYLNELASTFEIDPIYYYLPSGELVNSSDGTYIGWTPKEGDPIDNFMKMGQDTYVEDVRKGTETDEYYRFVYVKDEDGYFIQLGHRLESIEHLMTEQIIQSILERVVSAENNLVYALVANEHLMVIADTDLEDIGIDYGDDKTYQEALTGKTLSDEWYYPKLDETVIEIITPLSINDKIIGIVVSGLSQREMKYNAFMLAAIVFFVTTLVTLNYLWIQRKNIVKPINQLCTDIDNIDPNLPGKRFTYRKDAVFYGLYESIEDLLMRLNESKQIEKDLNSKITEMAYQDYLTKLPNRFFFEKEFEALCNNDKKIAVGLLDLNNFKEVNDTRGHTFGDELLILLGERLNDTQSTDVLVSRYGGDEFMFAIKFDDIDSGDIDSLNSYIDIINNVFLEPFEIRGEQLSIEASLGISIYPDDSMILDDLTSYSDMAMYSVKAMGGSGVAFYDNNMKEKVLRHLEVKKHLKEAINNDGFKMLYQPIIDVGKNSVDSYEALIRFKDYNIFPDEFIPIAESTGLIIPIGRYVIESAIKQITMLKSENANCTKISINFSAKQFYDDGIIKFIEEKLHQYNVSGSCLIIEITETFLHGKNEEEIKEFLNELIKLEIEVAMDDFGTGYTSVMFFNQFPFNTIKLDKSFVEKNLDKTNQEAFKVWLSLFKAYNYKVVAEGVETKEQFIKLKDLRLDFVQGYYFSRPVSFDRLQQIKLNLTKENDEA